VKVLNCLRYPIHTYKKRTHTPPQQFPHFLSRHFFHIEYLLRTKLPFAFPKVRHSIDDAKKNVLGFNIMSYILFSSFYLRLFLSFHPIYVLTWWFLISLRVFPLSVYPRQLQSIIRVLEWNGSQSFSLGLAQEVKAVWGKARERLRMNLLGKVGTYKACLVYDLYWLDSSIYTLAML